MTEVYFYHLMANNLEQILPELLEKTLERGKRAMVLAASQERVEDLATYLWTYRPDRFLPHGTKKDGHAELQPIWLTVEETCPNGASYLFLTEGRTVSDLSAYERIFEIFDGNDPDSVIEARKHYKAYKEGGYELSYWQQGPNGWVKQG